MNKAVDGAVSSPESIFQAWICPFSGVFFSSEELQIEKDKYEKMIGKNKKQREMERERCKIDDDGLLREVLK